MADFTQAMPELAVPRVSEEALEEVQVLEEALGEAPLVSLHCPL